MKSLSYPISGECAVHLTLKHSIDVMVAIASLSIVARQAALFKRSLNFIHLEKMYNEHSLVLVDKQCLHSKMAGQKNLQDFSVT